MAGARGLTPAPSLSKRRKATWRRGCDSSMALTALRESPSSAGRSRVPGAGQSDGVEKASSLLELARYGEWNPARAGRVSAPEAERWARDVAMRGSVPSPGGAAERGVASDNSAATKARNSEVSQPMGRRDGVRAQPQSSAFSTGRAG
jgi:hypothetical protein